MFIAKQKRYSHRLLLIYLGYLVVSLILLGGLSITILSFFQRPIVLQKKRAHRKSRAVSQQKANNLPLNSHRVDAENDIDTYGSRKVNKVIADKMSPRYSDIQLDKLFKIYFSGSEAEEQKTKKKSLAQSLKKPPLKKKEKKNKNPEKLPKTIKPDKQKKIPEKIKAPATKSAPAPVQLIKLPTPPEASHIEHKPTESKPTQLPEKINLPRPIDLPAVKTNKESAIATIQETYQSDATDVEKNSEQRVLGNTGTAESEDSIVDDATENNTQEELVQESLTQNPLCIDFINRVSRLINRFPGKKARCEIICLFGSIREFPKITITPIKGSVSAAFKAHLVAMIQRTNPPHVLCGKTVKLIM